MLVIGSMPQHELLPAKGATRGRLELVAVALLLAGVAATAACRTTPLSSSAENRPCDEQGLCLTGYACDRLAGICVPASTCEAVGADGTCGKCGNGITDGAEACDTAGASATCNEDCTPATCGDGKVSILAGETCDGSINDGAYGHCTSQCQEGPRCGDGITQPDHEACDDGGANSDVWALTSHCNADCTGVAPTCGDGQLDAPQEICDDGAANADAWSTAARCKADCSGFAPFCGDGETDTGYELCDDGDANSNEWSAAARCAPDCQGPAPHCGDGLVALGQEECDGGRTSAPGCTAACAAASGAWKCKTVETETAGPGAPDNICYECGNGKQEPGEDCDPGTPTTVAHCKADCTADPGWSCTPDPGVTSPGPASPNSRCALRIDPKLGDAYWHGFGPAPGVNGSVQAVAVDGSGNLYVGGSFPVAGGVAANNIAKWDGNSWSSLGTGMNNPVSAVATDSAGNIYAGGYFTSAGGVATNYVAKWSGSSWLPLGTGTNGAVLALACDGSGNLYAGGSFTAAGGLTVNRIAKWNGDSWSPLGSGTNADVLSLTLAGAGSLYIGGSFSTAGGTTVNRIAKWNGSSWSAVGTGAGVYVKALGFDPSRNLLYAGGPRYIAKWDGISWSGLNNGLTTDVRAIVVDGSGALYVGGAPDEDYPGPKHVLRYGSAWSVLGTDVEGSVLALALDGTGALYAGGSFAAGNNIARWANGAWSVLGTGIDDEVHSLSVDRSDNIYIGGRFSSAGGVLRSHIARWDGASWIAPGDGLSISVHTSVVDTAGNLYVSEVSDDGFEAAVDKWDGTSWLFVPFLPLPAFSLAADEFGMLYVGGWNSVGSWDGNRWSPLALPPGMIQPSVRSVAVDSAGSLYAGFSWPSAAQIAKWSSNTWSPLGTEMNGPVVALTLDEAGSLYAGGAFSSVGQLAVNYVAKWDGDAWSPLGDGTDGEVYALAHDDAGNLYVGGSFHTAGGVGANHIAQWDGSTWSAIGTGTNGNVHALLVDGMGNLYAGGSFTVAGGTGSAYLARFDLAPRASLVTATTNPAEAIPIKVTASFSEDVFGIDTSDFEISNGIATALAALTPGRLWLLSITPATAGPVVVSLPADAVQAVSDGNGNYASNAVSVSYVGTTTPPVVLSIERLGPELTTARRVDFAVTFSKAVIGVNPSAFHVHTTGTASGTIGSVNFLGVAGSYSVSVTSVAGDGKLRLDAIGAPVMDQVGNPLAGPYQSGEEYTVDNTPPDAPIVTSASESTSTTPTWAWSQGANTGDGAFRLQMDSKQDDRWVKTNATAFTPASGLSVGAHTLYVEERDAAGNWSAPGSCAVTITKATVDPQGEPPAGVSISGCNCSTCDADRRLSSLLMFAAVAILLAAARRRLGSSRRAQLRLDRIA